ncbi:galactose oxidase [Paenibacillus sp. FSL P4-0081]|nr:galactose oxidase [Paenibacillus sp. FSL P4-0081]OMF30989.1 galactose oxidase [Paenibacillus sp. FSL H8-0259]
MNTGLEKEFDLTSEEITAFLNWYDSANGSVRYGIDKHDNNKGPFSKRTEYVIHDKILTFEVNEYTTE